MKEDLGDPFDGMDPTVEVWAAEQFDWLLAFLEEEETGQEILRLMELDALEAEDGPDPETEDHCD